MKFLLSNLIFFFSLYSSFAQQTVSNNYNTGSLAVQWEIVHNNHKGKREFLAAFTLTNNKNTFPAKGWSIFFNFPRMIQSATVTGGMKIDHINGDFYRLSPTSEFKGLAPNQSARVEFVGNAWVVSISDALGGLYLVWDDAPTKGLALTNYAIKPATEPKQYLRYADDKMELMTAQRTFEQNKTVSDIPADDLVKVFPSPQSYKETGANFILESNFSVIAKKEDALSSEAAYLEEELKKLFAGKAVTGTKQIILAKDNSNSEAYRLTITQQNITISSGTNSGIFYGIQSLKTLIPPDAYKGGQSTITIPTVEVVDSPRFGHRAFMLDVARNFHNKQQLLKTIDLMALYKLNVLHLHFNDDEGWRLEIPGLPELTEVGARRGHTVNDENFLHPSFGTGPDLNSYGSGFYTRKDFIDILKYAKARHITVIPEIETPGHARAAIASMTARYNRLMKEGKTKAAEEYMLYDPADTSKYRSVQRWYRNVINVALPSTYRFLEKVVDEIRLMYKEADAPLQTIHFGGDEVPAGVWKGSPMVHKLMKEKPEIKTIDDLWYYFYGNINEMMQKKGLYLYGWEEIGMRKTKLDGRSVYIPNPDFGNKNFQVDVWNNVIGWGAEDLPYQLANAGYKVILSPVSNMYFDLAYEKSFYEPGYYWGGYLDVDKPFYFIPFDYYRNSTEDINGNKVTAQYFKGKERLTDYGKQNIPGIQGLLWSETLRSEAQMEFMLLPKLLALAERAWAKDPDWATEKDSVKTVQLYQKDWSRFANVLGKRELPRLDYYAGGFNYRIPAPGAVVTDGKVTVNTQYPGTIIRYTTDGKEPSVSSSVYLAPITKKGLIKIRLFNNKGRGGRVIEVENK